MSKLFLVSRTCIRWGDFGADRKKRLSGYNIRTWGVEPQQPRETYLNNLWREEMYRTPCPSSPCPCKVEWAGIFLELGGNKNTDFSIESDTGIRTSSTSSIFNELLFTWREVYHTPCPSSSCPCKVDKLVFFGVELKYMYVRIEHLWLTINLVGCSAVCKWCHLLQVAPLFH
jgi:hypothetical protein